MVRKAIRNINSEYISKRRFILYKSDNTFYIKLDYDKSLKHIEYEEVCDISHRYGLPKYTLFTAEEVFVSYTKEECKKINFRKMDKGYAYISREISFSDIGSRAIYTKKKVLENQIKKEARKCNTINELRDFHEKWSWYL